MNPADTSLRIALSCRFNTARALLVAAFSLFMLGACGPKESPMDQNQLKDFATRYTAAWCSQDAARVAAFFAVDGTLRINDGNPSIGRAAIAADAQGFMTAFPDLVVTMDGLSVDGTRAVYRWTLTGNNTGPGGSGNPVRISGYEEWTLGADHLIAESRGHFDAADYQRQLDAGVAEG
jgi:uncharacterized protein (TIGR02246 family)